MSAQDLVTKIKEKLNSKSPIYIKVKIFSKSPKNEIYDQMEDGTYKIRIAAQPVRGQANAELIKFLRKELGASDVAIVSGGRDKVKLIRISA
ncbi:DUF167 domain-containing protein [Patescibacteria group bacterium]|nr:DUF167 domain-containing protein [Patescibacteria group bacterium]